MFCSEEGDEVCYAYYCVASLLLITSRNNYYCSFWIGLFKGAVTL